MKRGNGAILGQSDSDEMSKRTKSGDLVIWGRVGNRVLLGARCGECGGAGDFFNTSMERIECVHCEGHGWFGIDPAMPIQANPGSVEKVAMLSVRYTSGVPLWNPQDSPEAVVPADLEMAAVRTSQRAVARAAKPKSSADSVPKSLVP